MKFDWFAYMIAVVLATILFIISLPLGSPHIFAYCLLSQVGTVPVDDDAFRIFCLRSPTSSLSGADGATDSRERVVKQYDTYDRMLPQSWGNPDLFSEVPE